MTLYGRRIIVNVAGLTISQPRIHVRMERQPDQTQTTGAVTIYNLSPSRERTIYQRAEAITVQAGYPDTIATIFDGQVQRVRHPRQSLARITHIEIGDQIHAVNTLGGVTTRTWAGPVAIRQIAADFVADMGLLSGPMDAIPADATITDAVWYGPSAEGLGVILRRVDVRFFEDDGVVRFRRLNTSQPDAPTISISPQTGLIGAPLQTDEGAECSMFLNPQAKVGGVLRLTSETLSGNFRIVGLTHDADNWDGAFKTWTDLREL